LPDLEKLLKKIDFLSYEKSVPLSKYTTWKVGGPAEFFAMVSSEKALLELIEITVENSTPIFVIGNGSNLLVSDSGLRGVVIRLSGELARVLCGEEEVFAGGGALLSQVIVEATRSGLSGLEFAFGIPGTIGGGVMTNAGAFSGRVSDVLANIRALDMNGRTKMYESFTGRYREPLIPPDEIVIGASFKMIKDSKEKVEKRLDEVRAKRKKTQPWGMATAGSVFKNPESAFAGELIEKCGLKGKRVGGAKISETHANFIINTGDASASDIYALIELARSAVAERFGVVLELEVQLVGFSSEVVG